jgi:hypothetical protein
MSGPLERSERSESSEAFDLDYEALADPKASSDKVFNINAIQKPKPIPKKYPHGFSFWETFEVGEAIHASAKLADIPISAWLRQTIRLRLRLEGWLPPHGGNGAPRT